MSDGRGTKYDVSYDLAGRMSAVNGPGISLEAVYADYSATLPIALIRNGVYLAIERTSGHSAKLRPVLGKYTLMDSEDPNRNEIRGYLDMCSQAPVCVGESSSWWDNVTTFFNSISGWLAAGGFIGAGYGVSMSILGGETALEALAAAAQVYGVYGVAAAAVFIAGVWVGTMIYDSYGNSFWLSQP